MTFWFGIGIMQLLNEEYNEHYPDEILNRLFDKLESWFADDTEIREVLLKRSVNLYTELAPTLAYKANACFQCDWSVTSLLKNNGLSFNKGSRY